jgi:release factor glutamine methyltransferase
VSRTSRHAASPAPAAALVEEPWTILRLMLRSADYLREKGVPSARLDAEHLLAHALGVGRLELYLQHERPLLSAELDRFRPLLRRRAGREPLQYILGRQAFRELDLEVGPAVLVPRPETEVLVDEVLAWMRAEQRVDISALDVGTGSGAIALSLAREGPCRTVVATDVSEAAVRVAERNRARAGLDDAVELRVGWYFEPVGADERFDVIVSNPPYVAETEAGSLEPEVREWEPPGALLAGPDGLAALRVVVGGAAAHLRPGGLLALEVGAGQAGAVARMLEEQGAYEDVSVRRDLAGKERIVLGRGTNADT